VNPPGNVDGMMNKIADFYDTECEATVSALTSLIEPLLIVFPRRGCRRHRHGDVPPDLPTRRGSRAACSELRPLRLLTPLR